MRNHALAFAVLVSQAVCVCGAEGQDTLALPGKDRPLDDHWTLVYEVGGLDGPDWAQFQDLADAAFSADGHLYLLDPASPTVVEVAPDGTLAHVVGRQGDGPGEYRSPEALAVLPDETVVVYDAHKRAFLHYADDGRVLDEIRPGLTLGAPSAPLESTAEGTLYFLPTRIVTGRLGEAIATSRGFLPVRDSLPLLRSPVRDGSTEEVAARVPVPAPTREATSVVRVFVPEPSFGLLEGARLAVAATDRYEIDVRTLDGAPLHVLERDIPSRPTGSRDRATWEAREKTAPKRLGQSGSGGGRAPPEPWYYPVISPIRAITTDGRSTIWVLRRDASDATAPGPVDLLSVDGRYLGTLPASARGIPVAFGPKGLVAFFEEGVYGVPVVRVYRLPARLR